MKEELEPKMSCWEGVTMWENGVSPMDVAEIVYAQGYADKDSNHPPMVLSRALIHVLSFLAFSERFMILENQMLVKSVQRLISYDIHLMHLAWHYNHVGSAF